jgi:hypothetical protein
VRSPLDVLAELDPHEVRAAVQTTRQLHAEAEPGTPPRREEVSTEFIY